jgi:glycopeptide antibiotics resistance protein
VLVLTLGPAPWAADRVAELPLGILNPSTWLSWSTWTTGSPAEFLLNIMMFAPLGVLAHQLLTPRPLFVLLIALTVLIEVAQIPLADRASDPRDLMANTLGGLAGMTTVTALSRRERRNGERGEASPATGRNS